MPESDKKSVQTIA